MATAFLLNPPRRKRRKSRRSGSRRRRHAVKSHRRRRRRNPSTIAYGINPKRKRRSSARRSRRRSRRRNPAVAYGINPRRRRSHRRRGSRRRNPGLGSIMSPSTPTVFPALRLPLPGIIGKFANGAVQAGLGGAIVFGGYVGSGMVVTKIEETMGATLAGKWRRPVLFGVVAVAMGALAAFAAKKLKGNPTTWAILGAAGPGLRAFGGAVANLMQAPADPSSPMAKVRNAAVQLADFVQLSDDEEMAEEVSEAGVGDEMGDFVQLSDDEEGDELGDDLVEAGLEGEEEDDGSI